MFKRMILTAAALLALRTTGADGITTNNVSGAPKGADQQAAVSKNAEQEKAKRITELNRTRTDLILKIHKKRQELLKNNPKLKRLYQQLLKQTRELALELNANNEMRKLNDSLNDVERQLKKELTPEPKNDPAAKPKK